MIPFITGEIAFGENVSELEFGIDIFDLDIKFQIDPAEKPQQRTILWVLDTCLIIGLRPLSRVCSLQKWRTETHFEKNVCLWARSPHHSIDHPSVFFWLSGPWFWTQEQHQFPECSYVWVGHWCWLNVVLQSLRPKDHEQITHRYAIQHPEKWFLAL